MNEPTVLLDEHVGRVFEAILRERGYTVIQAKDRFGEETIDEELLNWCIEHDAVLLSNNPKDFEALHWDTDHAGIVLYRDHTLPDRDPEGLGRALEKVFEQYGLDGLENEIVELDEWHDWIHGSP